MTSYLTCFFLTVFLPSMCLSTVLDAYWLFYADADADAYTCAAPSHVFKLALSASKYADSLSGCLFLGLVSVAGVAASLSSTHSADTHRFFNRARAATKAKLASMTCFATCVLCAGAIVCSALGIVPAGQPPRLRDISVSLLSVVFHTIPLVYEDRVFHRFVRATDLKFYKKLLTAAATIAAANGGLKNGAATLSLQTEGKGVVEKKEEGVAKVASRLDEDADADEDAELDANTVEDEDANADTDAGADADADTDAATSTTPTVDVTTSTPSASAGRSLEQGQTTPKKLVFPSFYSFDATIDNAVNDAVAEAVVLDIARCRKTTFVRTHTGKCQHRRSS